MRYEMFKQFPAVECEVCGKLHKSADDTYFRILGNVCIGQNGGIIGNNFDENGKVIRDFIVCRNETCVCKAFFK